MVNKMPRHLYVKEESGKYLQKYCIKALTKQLRFSTYPGMTLRNLSPTPSPPDQLQVITSPPYSDVFFFFLLTHEVFFFKVQYKYLPA